MGNVAFDFLTESFLFDDSYIETQYSNVNDEEMRKELNKYREHILSNLNDLYHEINIGQKLINTTIESFGYLPDDKMLKQLALYMDRIVIPDPLFEYTYEKSKNHDVFSQYIGFSSHKGFDKKKIAKDAIYMKQKSGLVASQFIVFFPISILHEAPKDIPLKYSETGFSDVLSSDVLKFFYDRVKISNVDRKEGHLIIKPAEKLHLGTTIHIEFDDESNHLGKVYQFVNSEVDSINDETHEIRLRQYIPDTIDIETFKNWVNESINQAAIGTYEEIFNEQVLSQKLNCMYLTRSQFTADLLSLKSKSSSINQDLANLSLQLDLPVFSSLSLQDIISVRYNYGEAFHNFRTDLSSKLLDLRLITDPYELKTKLQNVSYELNEIQVNEISKEARKIQKSFGFDALLLTGSLFTSFVTGGLSLIGVAGAVAKGSIDYLKFTSEVKENNSYFLWKLNTKI